MIDSQARIRHACKNNSINNLKPLWYAQLLLPRNSFPPEVVALSIILVCYTNVSQFRFREVSRVKKNSSGLVFSVEQITFSWDKEK